jgi:hypothetical protein
MSGTVSANTQEINTTKGRVTTNEGDISSIQGDVTQISTDLTTQTGLVSANTAKLSGVYWVRLGNFLTSDPVLALTDVETRLNQYQTDRTTYSTSWTRANGYFDQDPSLLVSNVEDICNYVASDKTWLTVSAKLSAVTIDTTMRLWTLVTKTGLLHWGTGDGLLNPGTLVEPMLPAGFYEITMHYHIWRDSALDNSMALVLVTTPNSDGSALTDTGHQYQITSTVNSEKHASGKWSSFIAATGSLRYGMVMVSTGTMTDLNVSMHLSYKRLDHFNTGTI